MLSHLWEFEILPFFWNVQLKQLGFRLFQSPKGPRFEENDDKYDSPLQWLYEEMESPKTPQLATARKNFLYKMGLMESKKYI